MRTERSRTGFTLTELLVATAILVIFGGMAVASLRYGSDLWRSCHRRSHGYNVATIIFHQLEDDIGGAKGQFWGRDADAFDTRVKFYVDYDYLGRQRLRFVRGIPDDTVNPRLRHAGDGVSNDDDDGSGLIGDAGDLIDEEYYNLKNEDPAFDDAIDEDLMPLEGMCEVAYLMGLSANDLHTLYRAVLAPIGDQFLQPAFLPTHPDGWNVTLFENQYIDEPVEVQAKASPLANGILHFEVRCWTQYTTTWDDSVPWAPWQFSYVPEPCGPSFTWDSRGFNQQEDAVYDNVFPRAIMVVVVVDPSQEYPVTNPLRLDPPAGILAAGAMRVPVVGTLPAYNEEWPYILIEDAVNGDEWIRFSHFEPNTNTFVVDPAFPRTLASVVRGTPAAAHAAGRLVKLGYTFSRVFHNPAGKEH